MEIEILKDSPEKIRAEIEEEHNKLREGELNTRLKISLRETKEKDIRVRAWEDIKRMCEGLE